MKRNQGAASKAVPLGLTAAVIVVAVFGLATLARAFGFVFGVPGMLVVAGMCVCAVAAVCLAIAGHVSGPRKSQQ